MAKGGRPKGAKSAKDTANAAHLAHLARAHVPSAIRALAQICESGESEAARVTAATAILDRAYGKPAQAVTGADGEDLKLVVKIVSFGAENA